MTAFKPFVVWHCAYPKVDQEWIILIHEDLNGLETNTYCYGWKKCAKLQHWKHCLFLTSIFIFLLYFFTPLPRLPRVAEHVLTKPGFMTRYHDAVSGDQQKWYTALRKYQSWYQVLRYNILQMSVHTGAAVISPGGRVVVVVVVVRGFLVGGLSCLKCPNNLCDVPHCLACTLWTLMFYGRFSNEVNRSQPQFAKCKGQVCLMFGLRGYMQQMFSMNVVKVKQSRCSVAQTQKFIAFPPQPLISISGSFLSGERSKWNCKADLTKTCSLIS